MTIEENLGFDFILSKPQSDVLIALTDEAEKCGVNEITIGQEPSPKKFGYFVYYFTGIPESDGTSLYHIPGIPLASLERIGLIDYINENAVLLNSYAFKRARYEKKSKAGKFLYRIWMGKKNLILGISFTLSVLLTILKISEIADNLF